MNIQQLESYNLADAVKFHNKLNPRLWGKDERLLPEVREKLLEIAQEFKEYLGVLDLDVTDITLSGSNAAYSYTPHSDIDLHLVVNVPDDEVYQELFNAKKYAFNDIHDIRIRGADVELYVQPADESVKSLGEYSVQHNKWIQIPRRKRAEIDQTLVRHKYEDIKARIESALREDDSDRVKALIDKIKDMRRAGLDQHGEFGPENLAFKMLRSQGWIKRLYEHAANTRDRELSLKEQPKQPVKYGFGSTPRDASDYRTLFKPAAPKDPADNKEIQFNRPQDYEWFKQQQAKKRKLAAEDAGETWDGVNPTTCMFLNEDDDQEKIVHEFIQWAAKKLDIDQMPEIFVHTDPKWSVEEHSFGRYEPDTHSLHVNMANRHLFDILRTTAHELAHCKQNLVRPLPDDAGETGSDYENEAHAAAGIIMRDFADAHPELFDTPALQESASGYIPTKRQARDPRYAMALTVDIKPGEVGRQANKMGLETDSQGHPKMVYKSVNRVNESRNDGNEPRGPEFRPTMPQGTVRVDVSDMYDWYKLGQHISNMKGLGKHDFGAGPPSTIISFGDEDLEHQYIDALKQTGLDTTDIDPAAHDPKKGQKTDPTYNVDEEEDLVESLRQEFEQLEEEYLGEIKMSTSNLRAEAAKTGAIAGMEFEMIVPNAEVEPPEPEYERDDDRDTRTRSFDDIENFFFDGDYNGRGDIRRLMEAIDEAYQEWKMDQLSDDWISEGLDYVRDFVANNDLFDREEALDTARDEIIDANPDLPPESDEFQQLLNARINELEEQFVQDEFDAQGNIYNDAFEEFTDSKSGNYEESDFLRDNYPYMSDIEQGFDITWPYYYDINDGSEGEANVDEVADEFSDAIGKPVNASSSYHGARREPGTYVVEPDGSLEGDNPGDAGLEFVSPPLPIDELLSDLNKVKEWAGRRGCYTNDSTGLHINISVPNYSLDKLDYVKLALLMGDEYVLELFGRSGNYYAKAATGKIRDMLRRNPDLAPMVMDKMRGHMEDLATKAIHSGTTDKYTSINTKSGYIEFRSPGGDWLDANFDKIENTLLRFTVALSAAIDPQAYRQEYLKKLYKLLEGSQEKGGVDVVQLFSNYSAGELDKAALIRQVREKQLARNLAKGRTPPGQKYWWKVTNPANTAASIEVVAAGKEEAIAKAVEPNNYPEWARVQNTLRATPLRPYQEPQAPNQTGNWGIWIHSANRFARAPGQSDNSVLRRFPGRDSALQWIEQTRRENPNMRTDIEVREIEPAVNPGSITSGNWGVWVPSLDRYATIGNAGPRRFENRAGAEAWIQDYNQRHAGSELELQAREIEPAPQSGTTLSQTDAERRMDLPDQTGDANWEIIDRRTGRRVFVMIANTEYDARRKYADWLSAAGYPIETEDYGFREIAIPGSTLDLQRQRANASQDNWSQDFERRMQQPAQTSTTPGQPQQTFTGQWDVVLGGEVVFRVPGENQSIANQAARQWILGRSPEFLRAHQGQEVEVVPRYAE